jgi:hypothetical protein
MEQNDAKTVLAVLHAYIVNQRARCSPDAITPDLGSGTPPLRTEQSNSVSGQVEH